MEWVKKIGIVLFIIIILTVGLAGYSWLKYEKHLFPTPKKITISLPFSKENEAQNLIPMGETINHPKPQVPKGHPGIDFAWNENVPIISVADGVVSDIRQQDHGWLVAVVSGGYVSRYKELDSYNSELKVGQHVPKGGLIGYPNHPTSPDGGNSHYGIHWEFAYNSSFEFLPWVDRLCPMSYFDDDAKKRIETIWDQVPPDSNQNMKKIFLHICSGDYFGKDD